MERFFNSFHSTKEGFKVDGVLYDGRALAGFHSTKEGFKVYDRPVNAGGAQVSIPPRKVSRSRTAAQGGKPRWKFPFHQGRFQGCGEDIPGALGCGSFHSTKEGFKVKVQVLQALHRDKFPFHQGRFQGSASP